jgi:hypothetical protein
MEYELEGVVIGYGEMIYAYRDSVFRFNRIWRLRMRFEK